MKTRNKNSKPVLRILIRNTLTILLVTLPLASRAAVNMKDASYTRTWTDLEFRIGAQSLKLERTYNSRSTFKGLFGFGWCSTLDTSLELLSDGRARLKDCRNPSEPELRPDRGRDGTYVITRPDKTQETFDSHGRLIERARPGEAALVLRYSGATSIDFLSNPPTTLFISLDRATGLIKRIETRERRRLEYKYDGDDLAQALNAWENTFSYRYDDLHNMIRIDFPDQTRELLTYDRDNDRPLSFVNREGCIETYQYTFAPRDHFTTEARQSCEGRLVKKLSYQFWLERDSRGEKYLSRAVINDGGKVKTVGFSEARTETTSEI